MTAAASRCGLLLALLVGAAACAPDVEPLPPRATITFDAGELPADTDLALVWSWFDGEGPVHDEVWRTDPFEEGVFTVTLDTPPEAHRVVAHPYRYPGLEVAYYAPIAFTDSDGDGDWSPDEVLSSYGSTWLVYLLGPIPPELADAGLDEGWNALPIPLNPEVGYGAAHLATSPLTSPELLSRGDLLDVEMPANYAVADSVQANGNNDVPYQITNQLDVGLRVINDVTGEVLRDGLVGSAWGLTVDFTPAAATFGTFFPGLPTASIWGVFAYIDDDANSAWTQTDRTFAAGCSTELGSAGLVMVYAPEPVTLDEVGRYAVAGYRPGWMALAGDLVPLPQASGLSLWGCTDSPAWFP